MSRREVSPRPSPISAVNTATAGSEARDGHEEEQLDRIRRGVPPSRRRPEKAALSGLAALSLGNPRVDADPRLLLLVGRLRNGGVGVLAHTFWIAREPSSPVGRKSMNMMRMPKMTMSAHWPPT